MPQNIAGISVLSQALIVFYTIEKNLYSSSNFPLYRPSESKSFLLLQLLQLEAAIAATTEKICSLKADVMGNYYYCIDFSLRYRIQLMPGIIHLSRLYFEALLPSNMLLV